MTDKELNDLKELLELGAEPVPTEKIPMLMKEYIELEYILEPNEMEF